MSDAPQVGASDQSSEQLADLLALLREVDGVELKLTIPDAHRRATVAALDLDPLGAQIRQVWFLDTPDLALDRAGLVARVRRVQGKGPDSVVKLRPVVPEHLPKLLRASPNVVVEVDAMPGGHVCSATMKGRPTDAEVLEGVRGRRPARKLFDKEQRAFFETHAPEGVGFADLAYLGPITVLKLKTVPPVLDRRLVAELWFYPDGSRILELSTKCLPSEAFQVAAEGRAYLGGLGIDLGGEQQTKTRTALQFFSRELLGTGS
jgi:hypothetical protein